MGGCYSYDYVAPRYVERAEEWETALKKFFRSHKREDLISAHQQYFLKKENGFFREVAKAGGIATVADIPKEFPEIEYEVKFDIKAEGKGSEPGVQAYLDAFEFPPTKGARFIKDPVNSIATGDNHFLGDSLDERLVVISKGGRTYIKEKGLVMPMNTGVEYENIVIKRTEKRYEADLSEILEKVQAAKAESGVEYRGKIRKEKGDAFILDTTDGRLYAMTFTRAHLTKARQKDESAIQRQLELEYAGHLSGFPRFQKDSEPQIAEGMVALAKQIYFLNNNLRIQNWDIKLAVTTERKYDFVKSGESSGRMDSALLLEAPKPVIEAAARRAKSEVKR